MSEKKGIPVWGWFGIGCGCLALVAVGVLVGGGVFVARKAGDLVEDLEANPAQTAAELVVRANPELDLVSSDRDTGTMTIRNRTTGEEVTVDFEDIAEGRIAWTTAEGEGGITFDQEGGVQVRATDESGETESVSVTAGDGGLVLRGPEGTARFGTGGDLPGWLIFPSGVSPQSNFASEAGGKQSGMVSFEPQGSIDEVTAFYEAELEDAGYEIQNASMESSGTRQKTVRGVNESAGRSITVIATESDGERQVLLQYEGSS